MKLFFQKSLLTPQMHKGGKINSLKAVGTIMRDEISFFTEWKVSVPAYIWDLFAGIYIIRCFTMILDFI